MAQHVSEACRRAIHGTCKLITGANDHDDNDLDTASIRKCSKSRDSTFSDLKKAIVATQRVDPNSRSSIVYLCFDQM